MDNKGWQVLRFEGRKEGQDREAYVKVDKVDSVLAAIGMFDWITPVTGLVKDFVKGRRQR